MNVQRVSMLALGIVVALASCAPASDDTEQAKAKQAATKATATETPAARPSPAEVTRRFPTKAFKKIDESPVGEKTAAKYQAVLKKMAGKGGMSATVLSPAGTWNGAVGPADTTREVVVNDQFAIGSVGKAMLAAQVMLLVERGELALDDLATDHLPGDFDFDTNEATIRDLLNMRSGIPDVYEAMGDDTFVAEPQRTWTTSEMLELIPEHRTPPGVMFSYTNTGALLLEPVIEYVTGRKVFDAMRTDAMNVPGTDRLIYQPDEKPTAPMALPKGETIATHKKNGGFLPSTAVATAGPTTGSQAADAPSLAQWWRALCAGEIVSQASLSEMAYSSSNYGLGLYSPYAGVVGHAGASLGYSAWAGCLPEEGAVIVVLTNREVDDLGGIGGPLVEAFRS